MNSRNDGDLRVGFKIQKGAGYGGVFFTTRTRCIRTDAQQPESGPGRQEAEGGEGRALPG